jgi:hypothetical protein
MPPLPLQLVLTCPDLPGLIGRLVASNTVTPLYLLGTLSIDSFPPCYGQAFKIEEDESLSFQDPNGYQVRATPPSAPMLLLIRLFITQIVVSNEP